MDRLLSDEEIENAVSEFCSVLEGHRAALREITKAQLAKSDADWWGIINSILINSPTPYALKGSLLNLLEERKRRVSIK